MQSRPLAARDHCSPARYYSYSHHLQTIVGRQLVVSGLSGANFVPCLAQSMLNQRMRLSMEWSYPNYLGS